ncbi:hypothetical protein BC936DRAFT_136779, partial [Jimgerdemannia flammicorona]
MVQARKTRLMSHLMNTLILAWNENGSAQLMTSQVTKRTMETASRIVIENLKLLNAVIADDDNSSLQSEENESGVRKACLKALHASYEGARKKEAHTDPVWWRIADVTA